MAGFPNNKFIKNDLETSEEADAQRGGGALELTVPSWTLGCVGRER